MKTTHQIELESRMTKDNKELKVLIVNTDYNEQYDITAKVRSEFFDIETVLHKIRLDIMTNLHFGFKNPIEIYVSEKDGKNV